VMLAAMGLLLNVAAGATAHVRAVPDRRDTRSREAARLSGDPSATEDRDRRRRDGGSRGAGARGGRRAAR